MGFSTFSTDNANYHLDLGNHKFNFQNLKLFEGIDALVLENAGENPDKILNGVEKKWAGKLLHYAEENRIPIYSTDIETSLFNSLDILLQLPVFPLIIPLAFSNYSTNDKFSQYLLKSVSNLYNNIPSPIVEGRNAFNAMKIEEYIAPELKNNLNKKPKIAIHTGAGHFGIRYDLESKERRDNTLLRFEELFYDVLPSFGFDKEKLGEIYVANYNGNSWDIKSSYFDIKRIPEKMKFENTNTNNYAFV